MSITRITEQDIDYSTELKIIVVHLNPISARLQFWIDTTTDQATGSLPGGFDPLATLDLSITDFPPVPHAAQYITQLAGYLGLNESQLEVVTSLLSWVETPNKLTAVSLVKLNTQEPPVITSPGRYITLLELLHVPMIDRLLFRKAYETLLGD